MKLGLYEGVNLSLAYCDDCGHQELEMDVCPEVRFQQPHEDRPDERVSVVFSAGTGRYASQQCCKDGGDRRAEEHVEQKKLIQT